MDLSPCPFCPGVEKKKAPRVITMSGKKGLVFVLCPSCDLSTECFRNVKELTSYWNTRSSYVSSEREQWAIADSRKWRNHHANEVDRARVLKERLDMPLERILAYQLLGEYQARIAELEKQLGIEE